MYRWRSKYGGLETSELQRLRELETENARLKKIVAQQVLDIDALKNMVSKMVSPRALLSAVERLITDRRLSQCHACQLVGLQRSSSRYQAHARPHEAAAVALIRE